MSEIEAGNDPVQSGEVRAADWAIDDDNPNKTTMFTDATPGDTDENSFPSKKKFGRQDSARGRDPLGFDKAKRSVKSPDRSTTHKFRENYLKQLEKINSSSILSENNIVDDE